MMEFWSINWGDVVSGLGLAVSLVGLVWVFLEARSARSASQAAESASHAAELAASETRDQIAIHLQTIDLQRAIGLIERIKTLHDGYRWEAAREHYQALRAMLSDVIARCPRNQSAARDQLATSRRIIRDMENFVRERIGQEIEDRHRSEFNENLNAIQSDLEELASTIGLGDPQQES